MKFSRMSVDMRCIGGLTSDVVRSRARRRSSTEVARGKAVNIVFEGRPLDVYEGESVAAALLAEGVTCFRVTARGGEPRAPYCGMGTCFDCVVVVDGRPNVRSCRIAVRDGMRIERQLGEGSWGTSDE